MGYVFGADEQLATPFRGNEPLDSAQKEIVFVLTPVSTAVSQT